MYIVLEHRVFCSVGSVALQRLFTPRDHWTLRPPRSRGRACRTGPTSPASHYKTEQEEEEKEYQFSIQQKTTSLTARTAVLTPQPSEYSNYQSKYRHLAIHGSKELLIHNQQYPHRLHQNKYPVDQTRLLYSTASHSSEDRIVSTQ